MSWVDLGPRGVSPSTRLASYPKPPLHILLTSVKLLALRVNVFYIKNILEQDARHDESATRVTQCATTTKGTRTTSRGEERSEGKVAPEQQQQGNRITPAHKQTVKGPLPSPRSRGFLTSAPNYCIPEIAVLRAGLRSR